MRPAGYCTLGSSCEFQIFFKSASVAQPVQQALQAVASMGTTLTLVSASLGATQALGGLGAIKTVAATQAVGVNKP